eukprot:Clim_evm83s144 gene=Clim_evmTU83s144
MGNESSKAARQGLDAMAREDARKGHQAHRRPTAPETKESRQSKETNGHGSISAGRTGPGNGSVSMSPPMNRMDSAQTDSLAENYFDELELKWIKTVFKDLAKRSPSKTMDKETFLQYMHLPGMLGERLFAVFDTKKDGVIHMTEFIAGLAVITKGSSEEKIEFIYEMFNLAGDEGVSKEELSTALNSVAQSTWSVMGVVRGKRRGSQNLLDIDDDHDASPENLREAQRIREHVDSLVDHAFESCDLNNSGKLEPEQFKMFLRQNPNIIDLIFEDENFKKHLDEMERNRQVGGLRLARQSQTGRIDVDMAGWLYRPTRNAIKYPSGFEPRLYVLVDNYLYYFSVSSEKQTAPLEQLLERQPDGNLFIGGCYVSYYRGRIPKPNRVVKSLNKKFGRGSNGRLHEIIREDGTAINSQIKQGVTSLSISGLSLDSDLEGSDRDSLNEGSGTDTPRGTMTGVMYDTPPGTPGAGDSDRDSPPGSDGGGDGGGVSSRSMPSAGQLAAKVGNLTFSTADDPICTRHEGQDLYGISIKWPKYEYVIYSDDHDIAKGFYVALRKAAKVRDVEHFFDIDYKAELGSGGFATVYVCTSKANGKPYACKVIPKAGMLEEERQGIMAEIAVLRVTRHPHIVGFKGIFDTPKKYFLIMELCRGGELYDRIAKQAYKEPEAATLFAQMAEAIDYLHGLGIVHRDLKPSNILFSDDGMLKLADFGFSKFAAPTDTMEGPAGTILYYAPEVCNGESYTRAVDIWSLGVILYCMVTGIYPFRGKTDPEIMHNITKGDYNRTSKRYVPLTEEVKDLIDKMLQVEPSKRLPLKEVAKHPWIAHNVPT